jgi:hypothetical protein
MWNSVSISDTFISIVNFYPGSVIFKLLKYLLKLYIQQIILPLFGLNKCYGKNRRCW